jgi:hypothetical protein
VALELGTGSQRERIDHLVANAVAIAGVTGPGVTEPDH